MDAYVNGEYVPEEEAMISVFDRGFTYGDSVFDATRTFRGVLFKLEEHLERLRKSVNYMELNGTEIVAEAREAIFGVVARSKPEIEAASDVLVLVYVTRGGSSQSRLWASPGQAVKPTVVVILRPLDHEAMAPLYESGVDLGVSMSTRHFQGAIDPRVKSTNRLEATRGELKGARAITQQAARGIWTVVFSNDGSISEAKGANIFLVEGSKIVRPPLQEALGGISLETACELGAGIGLAVEERKIWLYDVINADAVFLTASTFQLLPVATIDGIPLSSRRDEYSRLLAVWFELVGIDFVAQSRVHASHLSEAKLR